MGNTRQSKKNFVSKKKSEDFNSTTKIMSKMMLEVTEGWPSKPA